MIAARAYRHYPQRPTQLTPEFVAHEYDQLIAEIPQAEAAATAEAWLRLYGRWDALKSYMYGDGARVRYLYTGNLLDGDLEAKDTFRREKISPVVDRGNGRMTEAVVASRHREALSRTFGDQLLRILETQVRPLDPKLADLRVEESRLRSEYAKFTGTAEVEFEGENVTLTKLTSFRTSNDARVRKAAFLAARGWVLANRPTLAKFYADLVDVRQRMAVKLGDANFLALGYLRMGRTDYGPTESAQFRKFIRDYVVPLQTRLHANQARTLGTPTLRPWDVAFNPDFAIPMGVVPIDTQLASAQRVFDRISPKLSHHFSNMREAELIDLENRKGKAGGAYCTAFMDEPRVAIFCNSTGSASDVGTLMHEMGHAFQSSESLAHIQTTDLVWPTMDAAEICSMGMEYLSQSRMNEFFSADHAEKFRKERWKEAVELLCYVAIVDEFQHWVYAHPQATPDERDECWQGLAAIYQPSIDYTGHETLVATRWYTQSHIFGAPFYYIDYAIAEMGAMQLSLLDARDPQRAVEVYLELCRLGGTKSVLDLFKAGGLESPFASSTMPQLMEHAAKQLGV